MGMKTVMRGVESRTEVWFELLAMETKVVCPVAWAVEESKTGTVKRLRDELVGWIDSHSGAYWPELISERSRDCACLPIRGMDQTAIKRNIASENANRITQTRVDVHEGRRARVVLPWEN